MAAPSNQNQKNTAEIFDKIPPQDLEAERSVLGSILLSNESLDEVLQHLQADRFYADAHRRMFKAIKEMFEAGIRGVDIITLAHELQKRGELEQIGGPAYLEKVLATVPHAAHSEYYAKIVRERWLQRSLIEACTESLREAYYSADTVDEVLARAEKRVFAIVEDESSNDKVAIADILEDTFQRIFQRMDQEGTISGLHTGFHGLDEVTSGFQPSELIILAARPSMGKTALVCNFALAVSGAKPVWLSAGFVMRDNRPLMTVTLMGGDMQAQGIAQVLINVLDLGANLQAATDMARFHHSQVPNALTLESKLFGLVGKDLLAMGHKVQATNGGAMGGYQAIMFTPDGNAPATNGQIGGFYRGGSDHRKDGQVVAY